MEQNEALISSMVQLDIALAEDFASFYDDPLGFVMYAYQWGQGDLAGFASPDQWQIDFLRDLGDQIKQRGFDGINAVRAVQMATASGHGIGKSALTAWLVDFIMCTRPMCHGTVTANTAAQLQTKTWAEIAKWTRRCIASHWFKVSTGKGSMRMVRIGFEDDWFCNAATCREENSEAFAGQHAATSTSFYIYDEASAVPDKIWEVSEGGLTDGEPMWFVFGNPTRNTGRFYECFHRFRHRWNHRQIDSRTVRITNKMSIQEWIDDYGEDSDFVKVRVRGKFPSQSIRQYISADLVDAAQGRKLRPEQYNFAPKVLCCDPAWEGDDELVIGLLQGLFFQVIKVMEKNDNDVFVAQVLAGLEDEHEADAVHIDFGYGTGIYSAGKTMGRDWTLVNFGSASPDLGFANMRAYMAGRIKKWLQDGGAFPKEDETLARELVSPETVPRLDGKVQIEAKKDMKRRGVPSPNRMDCLGLGLALPVAKKAVYGNNGRGRLESEYNPLDA